MDTGLKEIRCGLAAAVLSSALAALTATLALLPASAQSAATAGPPPSSGGVFPLSEVHRGLTATAWTVFTGTMPEPMQVEILGVLRGGRGPGHDMILAQLHGAKPEYTGVVAGMSGSPVYVGNRLLGSLSYRIGQFSKDPIAGITPIEQMLEVRDIPSTPIEDATPVQSTAALPKAASLTAPDGTLFQAMETPILMSGFSPDAVKLWQQKTAGTGLDIVAAGGGASSNASDDISTKAISTIEPGSAVSAQLVRGDLEIAATCTVTYVDPKQLLACGHPILQAGPVSLPMTTTDVLASLASPLNAFKIVNTGDPIGAFTQDRDSAIRGVFGAKARMIPIHIAIHGAGKPRQLRIEVLDLPSLTPQAVLVSVYQALLQTNQSTADSSYHVTGKIDLENYPAAHLDMWAPGGESMPSPLVAALLTGDRFNRLYSDQGRQGKMKAIDLEIEAVPRRVSIALESARVLSSNIVHAGETVTVEATVRPWQQPERNIRIPIKLPSRLQPGILRMLISDAATLDRTLDQPKITAKPQDINATLAEISDDHPADRLYVSLLIPETQAGVEGRTLTGLPLSLANAMEPLRGAQDVSLNGESAVPTADVPAGGVLNGFQVLSLRIDPGAGVN